ncbi:MAG: hypothetical protein AB7F21_07950 [Desulfuromonadales bacterium]
MACLKKCRTLILLFSLFYLLSSAATAVAGTVSITKAAQDDAFLTDLAYDNFYLSDSQLAQRYPSYQVAANQATAGTLAAQPVEKKSSLSLHKVLGYSTVLLAAAAGVANSDEDTHHALAYTASAAAAGTVLSGYLQYGDQLGGGQGLFSDPNLHAILGTLGAAALIAGSAMADGGSESSHSGIAVTGAGLMFLSIIDIKW